MDSEGSKYEEYKLRSLLAEDSHYAFQLLYDRHRNRVYQTAVRYLKSPHLGQEVVQDVFMKLWFERHDLQRFSSLEAWIYTVARNNIMNRLKRLAVEWKALHHLGNQSVSSDEYTLQQLDDREYSRVLKEVVAELPQQQRQVFELARHEKLSYAEIGERLRISPLTVKTHMARALQQIRIQLAGRGIEIPLVILFLKNFF